MQSDILILPRGICNRGIVIPFKSTCAPNCCIQSQVRQWHHINCGEPAFLNEFGDVFCKHFSESDQCQSFFILDAEFQCSQPTSYVKPQISPHSKSLMGVAQGLQAAELQLNENGIVQFGTNLNKEVLKRWNR